jgi:predicted permease
MMQSMMDSVRRAVQRAGSFFRKRLLDHELDEEMAAHLEMAVAENVKRGLSPEEARRQALVRFGGVVQAKERQREERGMPWLDVLLQDLRYTFRTLRRDHVFTVVAVLILALGIGANIAVFSVVNTILLRPLPFYDPEQLMWLAGNNGVGGLSDVTYRVDAFEELQRHNRSFQNVTGFVPYYSASDTKLTGNGQPKPVSGVWVVGDFFQTLGVEPALGRMFTPDECVKGGRSAVVLSDSYWRQQFGADRSIVGKAIMLDEKPVTVVGVLPASFDFGAVFAPGLKMDVFVPAILDGDMRGWGHMLSLVGRLKPGVTAAQAQAEATVLMPQLKRAGGYDQWETDVKISVTSLKDEVSGKLRRSLQVLWCAVGLILLIVCVNLSNLLLARAATRSKEFALRISLGAGRGRLIRQLLTESLVLSGAGALLGLGLAYATITYLAHQGSLAVPLLSSVRVDGTALAWTVLLALGVGLLFGLAPGLKMSAGNLQESLKDSGPNSSDGRKHERMRAALVISEVALACILLVGAGLLLRSFLQVMDVDLGFQPARAYAIKMDAGEPAVRIAAYKEAQRRVGLLPGVESVGISDMLPLDRNRSWEFRAKGKPHKEGENRDAFVYVVTPGYLNAMGMRLKAGRDLAWTDAGKSENVILINEAAARREWPGEDPIGKVAQGIGDGDTRVVGVVGDVHESNVETASSPEVYVPATQNEPAGAELVMRSSLPLDTLTPSVMGVLRSINPGQPAAEFRPIQSIVDRAVSPRRFFVLMVGTFAGLGLILASLGIYGVISYSVTRRTQEIGIRMALGATPGRVQMGVISKTLVLAAIGIGVGAVVSMVMANLIASMLFGTTPTDPITFVAMMCLLGGVALLAGYIPARRASRINPMVALRNN